MNISKITQTTVEYKSGAVVFDTAKIRNMKRLYKQLVDSGAVESDIFCGIFGQFEVINEGELVIWTSWSQQGYSPSYALSELLDDLSFIKSKI